MAMTSGIVNRRDVSEEQDWSTTSAILEPYAHIRGGDSIIHEDHEYCSARDHVSFSTTPGAGFIHGAQALHLHYQRREYPIVPGVVEGQQVRIREGFTSGSYAHRSKSPAKEIEAKSREGDTHAVSSHNCGSSLYLHSWFWMKKTLNLSIELLALTPHFECELHTEGNSSMFLLIYGRYLEARSCVRILLVLFLTRQNHVMPTVLGFLTMTSTHLCVNLYKLRGILNMLAMPQLLNQNQIESTFEISKIMVSNYPKASFKVNYKHYNLNLVLGLVVDVLPVLPPRPVFESH
ncbi:hypothetical protein VNO77_34886 [Canavalia gladiata]|uniref:Uncharacterized protein n=1 Tax=Canavalia gladiata TaxID=3824 RepID=A0AAN9PYR9_CANGL